MNTELLILGGYGQFVWSAFIFTFVCCFVLYLNTKKELINLEAIFLSEYKHPKLTNIKVAKQKEVLSASSVY